MRNLFSAKNTKTLKQETHIIRPDKEFPNALKLGYIRKLNNIVDMVYIPILKCIATSPPTNVHVEGGGGG